MKIKNIIHKQETGFWADYECEYCKHIERNQYFPNIDKELLKTTLSNIKCKNCGKKTSDNTRESVNIKNFSQFNENLNDDLFIIKSKRLIDDTKVHKNDYPVKIYNKIMELEKLIYSKSDDDRKKFVKSITRLLGMTKWDLPDELYRYY